MIAEYHKNGYCGVEKSDVKVRNLSKKSADAGDRQAREEYASMCWWGQGGEKDRATAAWYASLVCNDEKRKGSKPEHVQYQSAEWVLGSLFQFGEGGMQQSFYLAQHYLSIAVERGDPFAYFQLAQLGVIMGKMHYDGNIFIPGFSPVPKALNWARKAFSEDGLIKDDKQATEEPLCALFFMAFGFGIWDYILIIPNAIGVVLGIVQMILRWIIPSKSRTEEDEDDKLDEEAGWETKKQHLSAQAGNWIRWSDQIRYTQQCLVQH